MREETRNTVQTSSPQATPSTKGDKWSIPTGLLASFFASIVLLEELGIELQGLAINKQQTLSKSFMGVYLDEATGEQMIDISKGLVELEFQATKESGEAKEQGFKAASNGNLLSIAGGGGSLLFMGGKMGHGAWENRKLASQLENAQAAEGALSGNPNGGLNAQNGAAAPQLQVSNEIKARAEQFKNNRGLEKFKAANQAEQNLNNDAAAHLVATNDNKALKNAKKLRENVEGQIAKNSDHNQWFNGVNVANNTLNAGGQYWGNEGQAKAASEEASKQAAGTSLQVNSKILTGQSDDAKAKADAFQDETSRWAAAIATAAQSVVHV